MRRVAGRYALNLAAAALIYAVIMYLIQRRIIGRFHVDILMQIGFNIILAVSLNLSAGYMGQLPLGHAGFMAIGAYTSALFTIAGVLPPEIGFPLSLLLGFCVAAAFGVVIGLPALRLRGDYLTIVTLGFGEIIRVIIINLDFTGGAFGLRGIPRYTTFTSVYICVLITLFVLHTLIRSRHGRAIISIREDEIAAEASGIPTTYYKVLAFAVSAGFAGLAGGLFAHYLRILDPPKFGFMRSAEILVVVVLGGLGSNFGSAVSATVLTVLPEWLRGLDQHRMLVYSLLLIIVMIFKPSGLCGRYEFSLGDSIDGLCARIRRIITGKGIKGGDADGLNS